jgi:hypothetical protein
VSGVLVADTIGRLGLPIGLGTARSRTPSVRVPVATVVGMVADGHDKGRDLAAYPDLEAADVEEALRYAAEAVQERELPLAAG